MAKKRARSYSWALAFAPGDPELARLSPDARTGLAYARELALNARERSLTALEPMGAIARLGIAEIALSPVKAHAQIKQARIELFGDDLSNSAIAYRLKKRRERGLRACAEPGCEGTIPALANGRRRYCELHASAAARVRRHRRSADVGQVAP